VAPANPADAQWQRDEPAGDIGAKEITSLIRSLKSIMSKQKILAVVAALRWWWASGLEMTHTLYKCSATSHLRAHDTFL
jgi:hypothetical protein